MPTCTSTRTRTVVVPANPYLTCNECGGRVEGFYGLTDSLPSKLHPCGHESDYTDTCPSWGPVDGCQCTAHLGYRPHPDAAPAATTEGVRQGPH